MNKIKTEIILRITTEIKVEEEAMAEIVDLDTEDTIMSKTGSIMITTKKIFS